MSKFSEFWKYNQYFGNPEKRMQQIEELMTSIDKEIQDKVDPTRWRKLLDQREQLEREMTGLRIKEPLRMQ